MIWLYWRRVRLVVLEAGVVLGAITALAVVAVTLGSPGPQARGGDRLPFAVSSRRYTVPRGDAAQVRRGLRLLSAAATACRSVSYHGVQMVAWSGAGVSQSSLIEVWHRSGQPELAEGDDDADDRVPGLEANSDAVVGVLSISPRMLSLLRENYLIEYAGTGSTGDRPALVVAVRRRDGTLAARYWLDRVTSLPLRRDMYDSRGRLVSQGAFINLQIGNQNVGREPSARARAWSPPAAPVVTVLRRRGWTVPDGLAGNMTLVGVTRTATRSGPVLDAHYSDGLSVVSVFIQRGELPEAMPGWSAGRISGQPVYLTESADVGERGLAWSAGGFVYTVIADVPSDDVDQVVIQLPHDGHFGIWGRVTQGLRRIGSWFDPFG